MQEEYFYAIYNGRRYDFEFLEKKFELIIGEHNAERVRLDILAISKDRDVIYNDIDEGIQNISDKVGIFVDCLQIPLKYIKNKDFRTLQDVVIDFEEDLSLNIHPLLDKYSDTAGNVVSDLHPSGDLIVFLHAEFRHKKDGVFLIRLNGKTNDEVSVSAFEVSFYADMSILLFNNGNENELMEFFNIYFDVNDFDVKVLKYDPQISDEKYLVAHVRSDSNFIF